MTRQSAFIRAIREHKRWADALSIVSIVLVIGLLYLASYFADLVKADETTRIGMYITMVGVVIVVCIWQAAAFVAASLELTLCRRFEGGDSRH
jgi:uncharacterized membrane-anchored protein